MSSSSPGGEPYAGRGDLLRRAGHDRIDRIDCRRRRHRRRGPAHHRTAADGIRRGRGPRRARGTGVDAVPARARGRTRRLAGRRLGHLPGGRRFRARADRNAACRPRRPRPHLRLGFEHRHQRRPTAAGAVHSGRRTAPCRCRRPGTAGSHRRRHRPLRPGGVPAVRQRIPDLTSPYIPHTVTGAPPVVSSRRKSFCSQVRSGRRSNTTRWPSAAAHRSR